METALWEKVNLYRIIFLREMIARNHRKSREIVASYTRSHIQYSVEKVNKYFVHTVQLYIYTFFSRYILYRIMDRS